MISNVWFYMFSQIFELLIFRNLHCVLRFSNVARYFLFSFVYPYVVFQISALRFVVKVFKIKDEGIFSFPACHIFTLHLSAFTVAKADITRLRMSH